MFSVKGWTLATIALLCWATLPLALKEGLRSADAISITWFRFITAALVLLLWQWRSGQLREFSRLDGRRWGGLTAAGLLLITNYVTFLVGLNYIAPANAQLFFQLAPLFLVVGGWVFFKEPLVWLQWLCMPFLAVGMTLFFTETRANMSFTANESLPFGVAIIILSSLSWAMYAILQKRLNQDVSSVNILLFIYILATVILFPFSSLETLSRQTTYEYGVLLFCAANTLVAYGCFAECVKYLQAVSAGAYFSLVPPCTFLLSYLAHPLAPEQIEPVEVTWLAAFSIGIVVIGAAGIQTGGHLVKKLQRSD